MIALRDVTKRFGDRVALDHVSLTVEPGAMHVLLGSSGSGKSTVLRLILGLLHPDGGDVRVEPLAPIGYVVQEGAPLGNRAAGHTRLGVVVFFRIPPGGGYFGDKVIPPQQRLPQLLR